MQCPKCHDAVGRHGSTLFLHYFGLFTGSKKFYCGHCGYKWRAHFRTRKENFAVMTTVLIVFTFGFMHLFETVTHMLRTNRLASRTGAAIALLSDKQLMGKIAKSGGDPHEALKQMSAAERQKIKKYVNSSSSAELNEIQDKLRELGISADASTMARIARFKQNPKGAYNDLTPDERRRIKDTLPASDLNKLKSQI